MSVPTSPQRCPECNSKHIYVCGWDDPEQAEVWCCYDCGAVWTHKW